MQGSSGSKPPPCRVPLADKTVAIRPRYNKQLATTLAVGSHVMAMKHLQKDMDDLKEAMNVITSKLAIFIKQQSIITELLDEIKQLKRLNLEHKMRSGVLMNDMSDHLPVFLISECNYKEKRKSKEIIYKRIRTEGSIAALKSDLMNWNWITVYNETEVEKAYSLFLDTLIHIYDKHCPRKQYSIKNNYAKNPWMTKGLQNACKKKNSLYRLFINNKTKEAELKYKKYKDKLLTIMRVCKKEYYAKLLDKNKN